MSHRNDIGAALRQEGTDFEADASGKPSMNRDLWISAHLLRCPDHGGVPTVFVASGFADVWNAVVDAVHWAEHAGLPSVRVALAEEVMSVSVNQDALATVAAAVAQPAVELATYSVNANGLVVKPYTWPAPNFGKHNDWAPLYEVRGSHSLPAVGVALAQALSKSVPSFRWYRSLSEQGWSGRVAGLEFCRLDAPFAAIAFRDYKDRRHMPMRHFGVAELPELCNLVQRVAADRADPQHELGKMELEHLLESGIWREAVKLASTGTSLAAIVDRHEPPLQVPALFGMADTRRSIDVVLRNGDVPWVVELKVKSAGQGEYYRHAIAQAVLYRHFVRTASSHSAWFAALGLAKEKCAAAVAIPALEGRGSDVASIRAALVRTANLFDVQLVELDSWPRLHAACMS